MNLRKFTSTLSIVTTDVGKIMMSYKTTRSFLLKQGETLAFKKLVIENRQNRPPEMQKEKVRALNNLFEIADKRIKEGLLSPNVVNVMIHVFAKYLMLPNEKKEKKFKAFKKKYRRTPPAFLVIAPTKKCNLHCIGCYTSSDSKSAETIPFHLFDRIMKEKTEFWGSHFTVITGGEPFVYQSEGKDILDMVEKHPDNFFMFYTNGTLITKEIARRMAKLGNVTPAVSVEGFEKETDERRGKGVFKKIMQAFENMREVGVPFGISVTPMRHNAEFLVSDEFLDFYFEKQKATYGWLFQYMPIGDKYTLDLMITPEQRLNLFKREREILWEKRLFYPDFWNSGVLATGCIASGREGGYLYIDWNGIVTPYAFYPYSPVNILEVYKNGGDLNDVYSQPFFEAVRRWQDEYGYKRPPDEVGNYIMGCPTRDHHKTAIELVKKYNAQPEDEHAKKALEDEEYNKGLVEFDKKLEEILDPYWKNIYLKGTYIDKQKKKYFTAAV